jgi:hypothetical protein
VLHSTGICYCLVRLGGSVMTYVIWLVIGAVLLLAGHMGLGGLILWALAPPLGVLFLFLLMFLAASLHDRLED